MAVNQWIVDASGLFICGGFYDPTPAADQIVVTLPDEQMPDVVNERYDATSPTKRRLATAAELAQAASVKANALAATHRQNDDPIVCGIIEVLGKRGVTFTVPQGDMIDEIHAAIRRYRERS